MIGDVVDITLHSEGALTYAELMSMTPQELSVATKRLNKYMKDKAEAIKKSSK